MPDDALEAPDTQARTDPARTVLTEATDKWLVLVVHALRHGTARHVDLLRALGDVGHPILTRTLRRMEDAGLVTRTAYPEVPPRVEYALTERGKSLAVALEPLSAWADANPDVFPPPPAPLPDDADEDEDEFF